MLALNGLLPTLSYCYVLATMNGLHRSFCDLQLSSESDEGWTRERLRVQFVTRRYKILLTSWEFIKLNQMANVGSALVSC